MIVGLAGAPLPADDARMRAMEQELQALRSEVTQLRAAQGESWLNEKRAEEVKTLIRQVLSDADLRASLQGAGATAGWNKGFFIASEDGLFLLHMAGHIQLRYVANFAPDAGTPALEADDNEAGFTQRRARLEWMGHILDPTLQYKVSGAFLRNNGLFELKDSFLNYRFDDHHRITAGMFKGPFLREELVSSKRQLTAERSHTTEFFTLDYIQGVQVGGAYERWRWQVAIHDGREADNVDFASDNTDFAAAGRAEFLLAGDWSQFDDFTVWSPDPVGALLGVAVDYENGEGGSGNSPATSINWEHLLQYTADLSLEAHPFTLFIAYTARHIQHDPVSGLDDDTHQWSWIVQGSVFLIPDRLEFFARYEHLDFDDATEVSGEFVSQSIASLALGPGVDSTQDIYTFGGNWYWHKHDAKFTFDVLWAPYGIRAGDSAESTVTTNRGESDSVTLRAQIQLLF